jgi:hypothetical protein
MSASAVHLALRPPRRQRVHTSAAGVEATWSAPGVYSVSATGITIRRRCGRWWVRGLHSTPFGPFATMFGALEAIRLPPSG